MLLTEVINVKWCPSNKNHYINKGYEFTKLKDSFIINVEDLPHGSDKRVEVKCDYCGKVFNKQWKKFLMQRKIVNKDSCNDCGKKKQKDTSLIVFGTEHYTQTDEWREYWKKNWKNGQEKISYEYVKECFKKRGYELLSTEYINNEEYLYYKCPKHGIKRITWCHFQSGKGCAECFYEGRKGENNNRWNGGITELNHYLRGLLSEWKIKSLEKYNYSCCLTGIKGCLEIHHIYPFNSIVEDTLRCLNLEARDKICDYSKEEIKHIEDEFLRIHMKNLGMPILPELHKLFHSEYGFIKTTKENFNEFINRFDKHEFDSFIGIKN